MTFRPPGSSGPDAARTSDRIHRFSPSPLPGVRSVHLPAPRRSPVLEEPGCCRHFCRRDASHHRLWQMHPVRRSRRRALHREGADLKPEQLVEGESYALKVAAGAELVRVRAHSGKPRRQNRVLVVPEHGDDDVTPLEVPVDRIVGTWEQYVASGVVLVDSPAFVDVAWLPKVEEEVELRGMGALRWTIADIDLHEEWAVVKSTLFTRVQERRVELTRIRLARPAIVPPSSRPRIALKSAPSGPGGDIVEVNPEAHEDDVETVSDISPAAIADCLTFSVGACEQYRQLEPRCRRGAEANRIRSRVRRAGKLRRTGRKSEYITYRVPGWFDIVLTESPSRAKDGIWVDELVVAPWRLRQIKAQERARARKRSKPRNRRRRRGGGRK